MSPTVLSLLGFVPYVVVFFSVFWRKDADWLTDRQTEGTQYFTQYTAGAQMIISNSIR